MRINRVHVQLEASPILCVCVCGSLCACVLHVTFYSITISHLKNLFAGNLNEEVEY